MRRRARRTPSSVRLLPWFALVPVVLAVRRRAALPAPVWAGTAVLPFALWVQEVLGHVTWTGSTAVHVPRGVLRFGGPLLLTGAVARASTAGQPGDGWADAPRATAAGPG